MRFLLYGNCYRLTGKKRNCLIHGASVIFNNTTRQKSIAFILSDFIDANYQDILRIAAKKHDIIGIKLYDKMDQHLPNVGMMRVEDAETGVQKWIDTGSAACT